MKQGEVVQLEIPSSPEYVAIVRHAVEGLAKRLQFNNVQIEDLKLAVGEACTNAVKYGCPADDDTHLVEIKCTVASDGLVIEIKNNIAECKSPNVPREPDISREGGLGLYLMRQLMDEVDLTWDSDVATVRMVKRLNPAI